MASPADVYEIWERQGEFGAELHFIGSFTDLDFIRSCQVGDYATWTDAEIWRRQISAGTVTYTLVP